MDVEECVKEWEDLVADFKRLETVNKEYATKLEEVGELQATCLKELNHQKYRMSIIASAIKRFDKKGVTKDDRVANLEKEIMKRKAMLHEIKATLPKQNSLYLRIILGNVNVSILNKNDKFKYKDEYEKFKLILSAIAFVLAVANLYIDFRPLQLILLFLLVWYYCTLTIRESILKVNGSRIKGWWRLHHFISTVVAGVLLIWPQNEPWNVFRHTFMWFIAYISVVQYMQFRYQSGVLYRLKALGARHNMDITIEGFHSWMWRGLSYLLPFLFGGYIFQLYIAYTLYNLSYHPEATWQVPASSMSFLLIGIGNFATTLIVIPQKLNEQISYLAALYLTLHCLNMYTILQTLHKKLQGGMKLRYKLRAIAYRLSNEIGILVPASSMSFLLIGIGNFATTLIVIPQKLNEQISYLAALYLTLHCLNMYTILQTLHKKLQGGMKLRYKLRAIAYRLSNEIGILEQKWRQNKGETKTE